jgi:two-component system, NarL family, nitrate/nitrite response regulator NarL
MPDPISVLIVEDHKLVAEGLQRLLQDYPGMRVTGVASTVCQAIEDAKQRRPDVVLMDSWLPDGDGADAATAIRGFHPDAAVVFLSADDSEEAILEAVRAGACGYLVKSRAARDVVAAVQRAANGETLISPSRLARLMALLDSQARAEATRTRLLGELTPREREVLAVMARGSDNQAIAGELKIALTTVRGHVQSILDKLQAHSKLEAVTRAAQLRLLTLGASPNDAA